MYTTTVVNVIAPLVGVLIGAGLQYIFGRTLEFQKQLALQKGQAYADFFRSLSASATQGQTTETLALATDAKTRACIYGSAEVIRCLGDFERAGAAVTRGGGQAAVISLLLAMRKDTGARGGALREEDLRHVLFGSLDAQSGLGS